MTSLFGGSKSSSKNKAYDYLMGAFSPTVSQGTGAFGSIADLLGQNGGTIGENGIGTGAAGQGFSNYLNSTGYNFMRDQGSQAITNNNAAKGLLNSGSTLKALSNYGQNMGANYFQNYLSNLAGLGSAGLQAGGLIGNAGQVSKSKSSNGIFNSLSLI
jgi:hypothetical protein